MKTWDLGDIIAAEGTLARSGKGDLYVEMTNVRLLTKSLRPLPDKHHGLSDTEQRYRQRYVDLIVNEDVRQTFRVRSQVIAHIRSFLMKRDFLEVETPMLQTIPGGAAAKPFETHHNALDMQMFLRIAPGCTSSGLLLAGLKKSSKSTATSVTKAFRPGTTPSSPCSSSTRPTLTTKTTWT